MTTRIEARLSRDGHPLSAGEVARKTLVGLALAHKRLGQVERAAEHMAELLRSFPDRGFNRALFGPEAHELFLGVKRDLEAQAPGALAIEVDELSSEDGATDLGAGPVPMVTVRVNFHCNQACHFCFVSTHLPDAAVREALVAAARRRSSISISGGEPTLNPRLAEYVRLAKAEGASFIELQTNAVRLADGPLAADLRAAGVDAALVSLHGASAAVSDAVTDAPGTFERTLRGIDALVAAGVAVRVNFVQCQLNRDEFPRVVELVGARWPGHEVTFSFVGSHTDVVPRTAALIPRLRDALPAIHAGLALADARGVRVAGFESPCGLPLCMLPPPWRARVATREVGGIDGEFVKGAACGRCALASRCLGVRRGYAELYGTDELVAGDA